MRGIADAKQAGLVPLLQPVDLDGEQLDVVEARDLIHAIAQKRRQLHNPLAKLRQAFALHPVDAALGNDIGALPVVAAVEHHHHLAGFDMAAGFLGVAGAPRNAEPEYVDWRADVLDREPCAFAYGGMTTVAADHQRRLDFDVAGRHRRAYASNTPA